MEPFHSLFSMNLSNSSINAEILGICHIFIKKYQVQTDSANTA